jgi:predicted nucleic acid-binding Zn ribbon protein
LCLCRKQNAGKDMPIYVFEPTVFEENTEVNACCYFETLLSSSEPLPTHCPTCGHAVHRALSSFGFSVASSSTAASTKAGQDPKQLRREELAREMRARLQGVDPEQEKEDRDRAAREGSTFGKSRAGNAAKLIASHVCRSGCRH